MSMFIISVENLISVHFGDTLPRYFIFRVGNFVFRLLIERLNTTHS